MFIKNYVRSKIVSLLRPWLVERPELELELGFLASHGHAKNLFFDISALNSLLDCSAPLVFKHAKIVELSVRFHPWSSPSIIVEVTGIHVTLARRDPRNVPYVYRGLAKRRKKELIASLDPEGASLHDAIERLFTQDIPGDRPMTSWADVIISCFQIRIQDILLELLVPEKSHTCLLEIDELTFESQCLHSTSLFRKFIDSLFLSGSGGGLSITCSTMKLGIKVNDQTKWIASLLGLSAHAKLLGFHFVNIYMHAPFIEVNLSPDVIAALFLILYIVSYKEQGSARTGKELWSTAANKIFHLKFGATYDLRNAVEMVVLWLRYVYTYNSLLTVAGHSHVSFKENRKLITQAKLDFGFIATLEEKLPAQMVVQARRISREKRYHKSTYVKEPINFYSTIIGKISAPFLLLWKVISFIFQAVFHFSSGKVLNLNCAIHSSTGCVQSSCFSFEEIYITCSHSNSDHFSITKESKKESKAKLPLFCLILRKLCLYRKKNESKTSFFIALSEIKLCAAASLQNFLNQDLVIKRNHSFKPVHCEGIDESKAILWSDPASLYSPQIKCNLDYFNPFDVLLENGIRNLSAKWENIREKHDVNALPKGETFLLCEVKYFFKNPYVKHGAYELWKCCLNVGKISLDLDFSSIISGSVMFRQLNDYFDRITEAGSTTAILSTSCNAGDKSGTCLPNEIELCANKFVGTILNLMPNKNVYAGAVIAGFSIQLSLKELFQGYIEKDISPAIPQVDSCHWIKVDVGSTEFAIWPASKSVLAAMITESSFAEILSDYIWLTKPHNFDDHQYGNSNDKFLSCGRRIALNVCLRSNLVDVSSGFEFTKHTHIVEPIYITTHVSICRDYLHTFYTTTDFHSVALNVTSSSAAALFFIDVLSYLFQVFDDMLLDVEVAYNCFTLVDIQSPDFVKKSSHELCSAATDYNSKDLQNMVLLMNATFEFGSVDIVLCESRKSSTRASKYADFSSCDNPYLCSTLYNKRTVGLDFLDLPIFGLGFSINKTCTKLSLEANTCTVLIDLYGLQVVLLDHESVMLMSNDMFQMKYILSECLKQSYQFHLTHCRLKSRINLHCANLSVTHLSNSIHSLDSENCEILCEIEESHCRDGMSSYLDNADLKFESIQVHATDTHLSSSCSFVFVAELGSIVVSEYHDTALFNTVDRTTKLKMLMFSDERFQKVVCKLKGGCIFLEALALTKFLRCFQVCSLLIASSPSREVCASRDSSISRISGNNLAPPDSPPSDELAMGSVLLAPLSQTQKTAGWSFLDSLIIDVTQFSLTLAVASCYGKGEELVIEIDLLLKLVSFLKKFVVDLRRLSVFTQHVHTTTLNENQEMQLPHFYSRTSSGSSSQIPFETNCLQGSDCLSSVAVSTHSKPHPTIENEANSCCIDSPYYRHFILKHMSAFASVEKYDLDGDRFIVEFNSNWVGNASISGLNLMIKLSEIQLFSRLYAPFSEIFQMDAKDKLKQKISSGKFIMGADSDFKIPDGAIVAIQDLQQHMYFTVEPMEEKYNLVGSLHYFPAGERALFKVRYHKRWWSRLPCMSFISLYAKDNMGDPLCLNFSSGSGFVGISGSDGDSSSLWQTFQHEFDIFEEEDDDLKTYTTSRKAFYVVNLKNDYAVAFVDGVPEFVKKPGNPLKVKLFDGSVLAEGIAGHLNTEDTCDEHHKKSSGFDRGISGFHSNLSHVNIRVDKVTLVLFHEMSDADDQFPLFRCCLDNIVLLGQILSTKLRVLCSFNAVLHQFNSSTNIWREFIAPVEFHFFYSSRYSFLDSHIRSHRIPVHFFLWMSHVVVSLTEVSLDVFLYLISKLNLAGPFAVRQSVLFPNSCKLENCTDLSVLFQFPKNQKVVLSKGKSSTVFLRFAEFVDQLPFSESSVSFSLSDNGEISTSPVTISLSNACFFAWRTHIALTKDSRLFPGPLVVAEVATNNEEGLSVIISPLLRLHNQSRLPLELCFRRPEVEKIDSASILLKDGDSFDDCRAMFDALGLYGGSKRALMSLTLGNFLLSVRPHVSGYTESEEKNISFCWSEEIKGGKAQRVSGMFDKLYYRFRKTLGVESLKSFFSTVSCPVTKDGQHISDLHFLIQTIGRDVPVMRPQFVESEKEGCSSPVAMQLKREIFLYPTVQVYNLLQLEISVLLHEDKSTIHNFCNIGRQATVSCQSSAYFYANPANIYFRVTLNEYGSTSKPVNCVAWVKKLEKKRSDVHFIDIDLDFERGTYYATLRLSCSERGLLEATIFTTYILQNNSELTLFCSTSTQKVPPRLGIEAERQSFNIPPHLGCLLPPNSIKSWFFKQNKVYVKWLEEKTSPVLLDLDILTGLTELSLEVTEDIMLNRVVKLGVSLHPCDNEVCAPAQVVSFAPRFIIANESKESIVVRQCHLQDEFCGDITLEAKQRLPFHLRNSTNKIRENNTFDSVFRRHTNKSENTQFFVQFCIKSVGCTNHTWSGPICIASLGRFFLKLKGQPLNSSSSLDLFTRQEYKSTHFAVTHIVEERSSLIIYFYMPPDIPLPYRVENFLQGAFIKYYQKDLAEAEILQPGAIAEYAWDDLSLPHRLIVEICDFHLIREININKICEWKPFFKARSHRGMLLHLLPNKEQGTSKEPHGIDIFKFGFEVYADGSTRVLRLCESKQKEQITAQPSASFKFRLSSVAVHFLENAKQMEDVGSNELENHATIIVARLVNVSFDSLITNHCKYNYLKVQSITVDEKWQGAPFGSMIRRSQLHGSEINMNIFQIVFHLQSTNTKVKQVKYSSLIIQPIDLKVDEETLMKLVPFWRSSNSISSGQSQQFYFKQFEIHPVKITASFFPGNQYPGYNSTQATLRSFLHSVLKVPSISNVVLELNGVLLSHTLVTTRELLIKCAQHYSWYLIRAIYIAKGSSLLPPAFRSIFDDTASSSLDVFFDPSDGSVSLPGLTLGMFKIISKCVNAKGFSGTRRYFGDLGRTMRTAGSNVLFVALTQISDNVLRGAETSGFQGLVTGFHQGILTLAMEPSLLGTAIMEGGPDRKIDLDHSPGIDELYIEGYLQAMLDMRYKQEYLRVRVFDNQVLLKNLPPNSSIINDILESVKSFLVAKALLKGNPSAYSHHLHLSSENDWKLGPTVLTLLEHLFVSFAIRMLRKQANKFIAGIEWRGKVGKVEGEISEDVIPTEKASSSRVWTVSKFFLSGMVAYLDGRLCRHIPNPLARRIVSGFMLSFLDKNDDQ